MVDIINQATAASKEQSSASEQISKVIKSINIVTLQSVTEVQQIAKTSEDLNNLTINLQNLISQFKIDESDSYFSATKNQILVFTE